MLQYFIRRLLAMIPKLLIITVIIFIGLEMVPGDPINYMVSPDQLSEMSPVQIENLRESLGLNDSLVERYVRWLSNLLKGDFGHSLVSGASIAKMLKDRMPATIELSLIALLIASVIGLILGFISSIKKNTFIDYFNTTLGLIGISVPEFFFGLSTIALFSLTLKWFPSGGRVSVGHEAFFDRLEYLFLPVLCLAINYIATLMRYTRGSMLDILNKDFIMAARSKGISEVRVNFFHGFRNSLIPAMIIIINRIPVLISGTVVIENVFNYPGMGSMLLNAISATDMPVVMITTLMVASIILLSSLLIDVFSAMLDPRIRFEKSGGAQ